MITVGQKWQPNEAISAVTVHVCVCFTCGWNPQTWLKELYFTTTSHTATVMTRLDKGTGRVLSWLRPLPRTSSACAYSRSHWLSVKLQVTLTQFDNYAAMLLCSCAVCCNLNFIVIHDVKWSCGCSHCGSQVPAQSTYISSISQLLLHGCWNHPIQSECG